MYQVESEIDVRDMARGAVFLGGGGGGDPRVGALFLIDQMRRGRYPRVIDAADLADDAFVVSIAGVGAPTVLEEYLVSAKMLRRLLKACTEFYGKRIDALISAEIGGFNSLMPLAAATEVDLPVVDGDGIGRAVPHIEMTAFSIYGCRATPSVVTDDAGNLSHIFAVDDRAAEAIIRAACVGMGSSVAGAFYPMSGRQVKHAAVLGSLMQTLDIGRRIRTAREQQSDPVQELLTYLDVPSKQRYARLLFEGRIVDVQRETRDGWHWARALLSGSAGGEPEFSLEIQNEILVARNRGRIVATVPDIITVVDSESAEPLPAERLNYGQRVHVIGYSADPKVRGPEAVAVIGPRAFGFDFDFVPIEQALA
ncbi:MAG TPA: DUF917 domain-containing protein [Steroidobacteraceae bacterium]|jgi:hypothetical protein|nr:DUF917 domain-containing protein [Steroidobacteraceae bacterium]